MSSSSPSAFESLKEKKQARAQWSRLLKDALDADSWGQSIEATEQYEKLYRLLEVQIPGLQLNPDERSTCLKVAHSVSLRMNTLQGVEAAINDGPSHQPAQKLSLDQARALQQVIQDLFDKPQNAAAFPIELRNYTARMDKQGSANGEVFIAHEDRLEKESHGSLLMPPKVKSGMTTISITIDKIGLKDAQTYINSFMTVSVADPSGQVVESQDTPKSNALKPNYVMFGNVVHVQVTLEEFQKKDLCLFFEFKHFKPQKKKISTRCYALLESKELQQAKGQSVCLELYKKPTDFGRKSLSLFTIKQLYLHLTIAATKH